MWPINYLVPLQQPMLEGTATVAGTTVVTSRGAGAWGPADPGRRPARRSRSSR